MALVLSETDYKRVTILAKVAGIFTFAAGTIMLIDHSSVKWFVILVLLGILAVLAPLPMSVIKPDSMVDDADTLAVDSRL
jgi:hypothetical protein